MKIKILLTAALVVTATGAFAQDVSEKQFMRRVDRNKDGQVTLAEYQRYRNIVFKAADTDRNNVLSADELTKRRDFVAQSMVNNGNLDAVRTNRYTTNGSLSYNDANGDGVISYDEWVGSVPAWFAKADRNGDNVLTAADFN